MNHANEITKNLLAAQTTYVNLYMSYGGTNWGNLAEPTVYTSCVFALVYVGYALC